MRCRHASCCSHLPIFPFPRPLQPIANLAAPHANGPPPPSSWRHRAAPRPENRLPKGAMRVIQRCHVIQRLLCLRWRVGAQGVIHSGFQFHLHDMRTDEGGVACVFLAATTTTSPDVEQKRRQVHNRIHPTIRRPGTESRVYGVYHIVVVIVDCR
jgi:hypothetical protein